MSILTCVVLIMIMWSLSGLRTSLYIEEILVNYLGCYCGAFTIYSQYPRSSVQAHADLSVMYPLMRLRWTSARLVLGVCLCV